MQFGLGSLWYTPSANIGSTLALFCIDFGNIAWKIRRESILSCDASECGNIPPTLHKHWTLWQSVGPEHIMSVTVWSGFGPGNLQSTTRISWWCSLSSSVEINGWAISWGFLSRESLQSSSKSSSSSHRGGDKSRRRETCQQVIIPNSTLNAQHRAWIKPMMLYKKNSLFRFARRHCKLGRFVQFTVQKA